VLRLCRAAGLVQFGHVAVDGTKLKANASRHKAMSYGRMKTAEPALAAEVEGWLARANEIDASLSMTKAKAGELKDRRAMNWGLNRPVDKPSTSHFSILDGDGNVEFDLGDDRFLYVFSSYAESTPPVKIMALRDGAATDVTREDAFRPVVERRLTASMRACFEQSTAGVCAGALGNAALLGYFPAALELMTLEEIDRQMEDYFLDCDDSTACKGKKRFQDFAEAAAWRLQNWGYKTRAVLDDKVNAFARELASAKDGYAPAHADPDTEFSCNMGPLTFEYDPAKGKALVRGYEFGCNFGAATVLKDSLVVDLLCSGEADFWLDRHVYERDGEALMSLSVSGALDEGATRLDKCPAKSVSQP
jgi:hypothetical protein